MVASTLKIASYSLISASETWPKVTIRVADAMRPLRLAQIDAETRLPTTALVGSGCLNL